ncbi:hypothetical protein DM01DRAFT_1320789 [Hesseltinella vesiculosa]|uniref:Uncharacterized protein n=1 Tax=Hesseltinella vesiculosa TaxID=101127 RepID=A0A1X2GJT5_9FUNG|nr:hypothetical protein DM01DRAFT_1320789 [Hesseltinella vesiculosa]
MLLRLEKMYQGMIYAFQGIYVVMQNPALRQEYHLRVFLQLSLLSFLLVGIARIMVGLPFQLIRILLWAIAPSLLDASEPFLETAHDTLHNAIAGLPFLLLLLMRYLYPKPLDQLFMSSLQFIDDYQMHPVSFAKRLAQQPIRSTWWRNLKDYLARSWVRWRIGLILTLLSMIPLVGSFVFPVAGALSTFKSLGRTQAIIVGICFLCLPSWLTKSLVRAALEMRMLMRELLEPYFVRMSMTHKEKRRWFHGRRDTLFGFSLIAWALVQWVPFFNFLAYGIVQAAASYMLVIVTDLPPPHNASSLTRKNK